MNNRLGLLLVVAFVLAVLVVEPAFAGPGGKIARAMFETFWGRVALVGLTIVLSPLIAYVWIKEKLAERRARNDLRFMAQLDARFDWLKVKERASDCFLRVHRAWSKQDVSEAAQWMTDWYWQNQQLVHLDNWARQGLVNHCAVKKIVAMKPLLFVHRNDGGEHEDSLLVLSISAHMCDYLERIADRKVVEGSKKFKDVETIWTLTMTGGRWLVSNIEEDSMSFAYAKLARDLPAIEATLMRSFHA